MNSGVFISIYFVYIRYIIVTQLEVKVKWGISCWSESLIMRPLVKHIGVAQQKEKNKEIK
jgi:hypothetical protein